jgi:cysteine desulfurase
LSVAFTEVQAHALSSLISNEVYLSTGSACHSDSIEISPVLKAMRIEPMIAAGTVRISTGKFTTEVEVDYAVEAISRAVLKLSN